MSMKVAVWIVIAVIIAALGAAYVVKSRNSASPQDPPGIIFERTDRPAKA